MSVVAPCETHTFLPTKIPYHTFCECHLSTFLQDVGKSKKKGVKQNFLSSMTNWQPFGGTKSVAQAKKWR